MTRKAPPRKGSPRRRARAPAAQTRADSANPANTAATTTSDATDSGFAALVASARQQVLPVTCWIDPAHYPAAAQITVHYTGRRAGAHGRLQAGDHFIHEEAITDIVPGSGPLSITAHIRDVTPGAWSVTASVTASVMANRHATQRSQTARAPAGGPPAAPPAHGLAFLWSRWAPAVEVGEPLHTCPTPFARTPGTVVGAWAGFVGLGVLVALVAQSLLLAYLRLPVGPVRATTLFAIAIGAVGAKLWYIVQYKAGSHWQGGWCIQGFIVGAGGTAALAFALLRLPTGAILDATAPGLLVAMAIGRIGCFFAGCCGGPPTAARWGVWSSDQRVGARRVPTQLMESGLALGLGLGALAVILAHGAAGGALFIAGIAAYTLARQGILRLRADVRQTRLGMLLTAGAAALALVAALAVLFAR
jgi:phosphatidylglycerol---prolipoprotein diacylglyceryl transferase